MAILLWDASALAKRYIAEVGTDVVNALFTPSPGTHMVSTLLSYAEAFSVLLRNNNRGTITATTFLAAKSGLRVEVIEDPGFELAVVDDAAIFAGISLMELYNVNANDGAILAAFLRYLRSVPPAAPAVLVASDNRLLTAAAAEGLRTLNPEAIIAAEVSALLDAL